MPIFIVRSNAKVEDVGEFLKKLSKTVSEAVGKPETYVLCEYVYHENIIFQGVSDPVANCVMKSIGLVASQVDGIAGEICKFLESELGVVADRVYMDFSSPTREFFSWKGKSMKTILG